MLLVPPAYVRPSVKRGKTDRADAGGAVGVDLMLHRVCGRPDGRGWGAAVSTLQRPELGERLDTVLARQLDAEKSRSCWYTLVEATPS